MISPKYCQAMAEYNSKMNIQLYGICETLSDQARTENVGLFFGSIHRTLDHILFGDMAWLLRFEGRESDIPELNQQLFSDFSELSDARNKWDKNIVIWSSTVDEGWLTKDFTYTSQVDDKARTRKAWLLVCHMFNHQTHHRGQLTAALSRMGYDFGVTDLPFLLSSGQDN